MTSDWRTARDTALFKLENEKTPALRAEAVDALCDLAAEVARDLRPEFGPALVRLLADAQSEVRCGGVALAALILPPEEAEALLIRHLTDKDAQLRIEATGRLADLGRPSARGALAQAMRDELLSVRFEAARGMAGLKHSSGLEVLVEALGDNELRFRAVSAIAELGDKEALPALQRLFARWFLPAFDRTQVAAALVKLGDPSAAGHLFKRAARTWSVDRAMAIELLGEVKAPGARARLEQILKDPADLARGAAARGLGRLGDVAAMAALQAVLAEPNLSDDLKLDLAEGLWRLPGGRLLLEGLAFSSPEARAELEALLSEAPPP
ncbi:MAG: repeat-containing lyase [Myxococcaceae bacterium]|nr:repeat-containing lyase [Myxococcaceae bacterium]